MDQSESIYSLLLQALESPTSHKMVAETAELLALDARFSEWAYEHKSSSEQTEDQVLGLLELYDSVTSSVSKAVHALARERDEAAFRNAVALAAKELRDAMQQ